MTTPRQELVEEIRVMRDRAIGSVRSYARTHCPLVSDREVKALTGALGDISVDEAIEALDRWQAEAAAKLVK